MVEIPLPANFQFSKAFMGLQQAGLTERNHHVNSKTINPLVASDFLNIMKNEELEPWSVPPQSSNDTFGQLISQSTLNNVTIQKPQIKRELNRNLDTLIKKAAKMEKQI